ncbi:MAG: DUF1697 domain-containing protein [Archangium sp.]
MATSGKPVLVALLRGINVGGNKKVPMETLRKLAEKAGFTSVKTYINSGNLLFRTGDAPAKVEATLEKAIAKEFGFTVDVVVRTADAWEQYAKKSGFPDVEKTRPNLLLLGLAKSPVAKGAAEALNALAKDGERVKAIKDALWIDYAEALGRSKLTPAALDKHTGSPVTGRNWNTVLKLAELMRELE